MTELWSRVCGPAFLVHAVHAGARQQLRPVLQCLSLKSYAANRGTKIDTDFVEDVRIIYISGQYYLK